MLHTICALVKVCRLFIGNLFVLQMLSFLQNILLQKCIASNESSGIDIVVSLIQTELTALEDYQEKAMQLKVII